MAYVTCAISGVLFECSHFHTLRLPANIGYPHPIFAANKSFLQSLYVQHSKGLLTATDSYLLFMAYLHSSSKVDWRHPATAAPTAAATIQLVETNLAQLLSVLERTAAIRHPRFKQPSFVLTYENANLAQIPNWIKAWEDNIEAFYNYTSDMAERSDLIRVENKLTNLILSGEPPAKYSATIAAWASKAAQFPPEKDTYYQEIIRSCFNAAKMFATPLADIKEVKAFCEENIQVGSMHFHSLAEALKSGVHKHIDYLGGSHLALGYTILDSLGADSSGMVDTIATGSLPHFLGDSDGATVSLATASATAEQRELLRSQQVAAASKLQGLIATAPTAPPIAANYSSTGDFLRAKLAYRVAAGTKQQAAKANAAKAAAALRESLSKPAPEAPAAVSKLPAKADLNNL